ncbi:hypothetical protein, partial [Escherichia coli]|uniref:hypothetical protein n=1 Tax=Escherichia coli TaxID=562 RepID=UPI0022DF1C62
QQRLNYPEVTVASVVVTTSTDVVMCVKGDALMFRGVSRIRIVDGRKRSGSGIHFKPENE